MKIRKLNKKWGLTAKRKTRKHIFPNDPESIWGNMMGSIGFNNAGIINHAAQA